MQKKDGEIRKYSCVYLNKKKYKKDKPETNKRRYLPNMSECRVKKNGGVCDTFLNIPFSNTLLNRGLCVGYIHKSVRMGGTLNPTQTHSN